MNKFSSNMLKRIPGAPSCQLSFLICYYPSPAVLYHYIFLVDPNHSKKNSMLLCRSLLYEIVLWPITDTFCTIQLNKPCQASVTSFLYISHILTFKASVNNRHVSKTFIFPFHTLVTISASFFSHNTFVYNERCTGWTFIVNSTSVYTFLLHNMHLFLKLIVSFFIGICSNIT